MSMAKNKNEINVLMFCSNPVDGGTARIFFELANAIERESDGIKVYICVNKNNPVEIYKKLENIIYLPVVSEQVIFKNLFYNTGIKRISSYIIRKIRYQKIKRRNISLMCRYIRNHNINAVIIHNGGYVGDDLCNQMLNAAFKCKKKVKERVMVWHNDMEKDIILKLRYWIYDKKIDHEATKIVTVSNFTKNRIYTSSFIKKEINVIYNGLKDRRILSQKEKEDAIGKQDDGLNVLMIGNFSRNKGQSKLIEAAKILYNENINFMIIGNIYDDKYYHECEKKIIDWGLQGKIRILHGIHNAYEYIELFDVLAVTSLYDESFGLISLEAMIAGCPIVAFECGGIPEVIRNGENGIVVSVGDSEGLARSIKWLYEHPDKRKDMGKRGIELYKEYFSEIKMKDAYVTLLK